MKRRGGPRLGTPNAVVLVGLVLAVGIGIAVPGTLAAQGQGGDSTAAAVGLVAEPAGPPAAVLAAAAETITAAELARHLRALAADSLRGRATSGAALAAAARYVAAYFQQLGLQPGRPGLGNEYAQWLKHYPLPGARRNLNLGLSQLRVAVRLRRAGQGADALNERGRPVERSTALDFATTARLAAGDSLAESMLTLYAESVFRSYQQPAPVLVVSGRHPAATLPCEQATRPLLLYVPPAGLDSAAQAAVLAHLTHCSPVLVVAAADADSATWAKRQAAADTLRPAVFERYLEEAVGARAWAVYAAPPAVRTVLQAAGLDLAATWADTTPRVRALPALRVWGYLSFSPVADSLGVYVTGVLVGSDSVPEAGRRSRPSAESYVVYSAALDGSADATATAGAPADAGARAGAVDPASPAAATETSVAGLLALAKAFTQPGVRPSRSVLFLATSGAGRQAATSHLISNMLDETGSMNLTLEQLGGAGGRGGDDTLAIAGLSEFRFARPPAWLAQAHPELGLTVVDGGTILRPGTEAYAFARSGAVSLALAPAREADAADAAAGEAAAPAMVPAVRFAFYLGQELANTDSRTRPQWTSAARTAWLRGVGR